MKKEHSYIQHAENGGEYNIRINGRLRGVDGFCKKRKIWFNL